MFDFRLSRKDQSTKGTELSIGARKKTILEPILENQAAHIAHLKKPVDEYLKAAPQRKQTSQASTLTALSQPDNGILFLDNDERIFDPKNMKTPPPPKWGEPIEEDFYDPAEEFFNADKARQEKEKRKFIALQNLKDAVPSS